LRSGLQIPTSVREHPGQRVLAEQATENPTASVDLSAFRRKRKPQKWNGSGAKG